MAVSPVPRRTVVMVGWGGLAAVTMMVALTLMSGCKRNPRVVPVTGKVLYNGKPLPFGSVMFQPAQGQAAVGDIRPDGTFTLSSYAPDDGAVPGEHKVSVRCFENQRPDAPPPANPGEVQLGDTLIPLHYTRFGQSGLTVTVADGATDEVVLELSGPPLKLK